MNSTEMQTQSGSPSDDTVRRNKAIQKAKFYGVVSVMTLLCGGFIWFLFSPADNGQGADGLNTAVPTAIVQEPEADKRKAFEQNRAEELRHERVRTFEQMTDDDLTLLDNPNEDRPPEADAVHQSQAAYSRVQGQMATFYTQPREDPQVAELKRELAALAERLDEQTAAGGAAPQTTDPMKVMEKSYELAARYFPQGGSTQPTESVAPDRSAAPTAVRVRRAGENVTSTLAEPAPLTLEERNWNFYTPVGDEQGRPLYGAIRACVAENQVVADGTRTKLRLLEPLQVGDAVVPANTLLYCVAHIDGQRLSLTITSIESGGRILPVSLTAYDTDGLAGLYIPRSAERTALKNAAAGVSGGLGNSFSLSRNAGAQIASDLTRGMLTGGSQYLSSKLREVKISLKTGYRILLVPNDRR